MANWLKRSVLAIEAGFSPEEAVLAKSWRAAEELVHALFDPAVALCRSIADLRAGLPRESSGVDAVQQLDASRPSWRSELPFDLEEQDVRRLVEDLVRVRREESHGLTVTRNLRKGGDGWTPHAELALSGALDHRKLPHELRTALQGAGRVRLRPGGALAEFGRVVAALERLELDGQDRWDVRPLVQGFDVRLGLADELRLQVIAGEALLAEFVAFGGDPVEGPVIALEPVGAGDIDEVRELNVLGASPVRSPRPWLVLAIEAAALETLIVEGERRDLGPEANSGRTLVAFQGRAELDFEGERLVWKSGDEKREALRLSLVGDLVRSVSERVFKGCPGAWLTDESRERAVSRSDLTWRAVGSKEWTSAAQSPPLGRVELSVRRKGELIAWTRAEVAPADFDMKADARTRSLALTGLAGAIVGAAGTQLLPCRRIDEDVLIDLSHLPRGAVLKLRLRWTNTMEMSLPDPVTEPVLLGPEGRPAENPRLAVGRLTGYRLLAPQRSTLLFELRRAGARPLYAARTVEGIVPLVAYAELVRQLLGGCEELDAFVRLSWAGRGDRIADIGWYDLARQLTVPESSSPFAILATSTFAPSLVAFSLVEPKPEVVRPPLSTASAMRAWLIENAGEGPWLISGTTQKGFRLRPKVLGEATGSARPGLVAALRQTSRDRRDAAIDNCLVDRASLDRSDTRLLVDLALAATRADVPYAAVDALRGLCRAPSAAVFVLAECASFQEAEAVLRLQSELPMLWCTSPIKDWIEAFAARRKGLVEKLAKIDELASAADASIAAALVRIVDLQPALRVHAQTALLLSGAEVGSQAAKVDWLRRLPDTDLVSLAQEVVRRNADGADPPVGLGLAQLAESEAALWTRYDPAFADLIAAPIVAAGIALGEYEAQTHIAACRTAWLFDREYFEAAILGRLFSRVRS